MPKALTTRLPLTVSCRIWLNSPRRSWLFATERRMPDSLNQEAAQKLRNGFGKEHDEERDGDNGPDIVNGRRKELIEIDRAIAERDSEQLQSRVACSGVQNAVKDGGNDQGDESLGHGDKREQGNAE